MVLVLAESMCAHCVGEVCVFLCVCAPRDGCDPEKNCNTFLCYEMMYWHLNLLSLVSWLGVKNMIKKIYLKKIIYYRVEIATKTIEFKGALKR